MLGDAGAYTNTINLTHHDYAPLVAWAPVQVSMGDPASRVQKSG